MVSDGKTRRRMNQREWECFEDGVNYERDRIIKLLKQHDKETKEGKTDMAIKYRSAVLACIRLIKGKSND